MARNNREEWKTYNNVFDNYTNRLLFKLSSKGFFEELKSAIALGKEANVFSALTKDDNQVAIKIYRLEACNFNKMYYYIANDPRFLGLPKSRRKIIFSWVQREYRNLLKAREFIRVPTPIVQKDHILIMEFIGDKEPSPLLKDKIPSNKKEFYEKIINNIILLWNKARIVHGDLSEFNIINYNEEPIFIDFSQSTPIDSFQSKELLERDINNINRFFKKIGLETKSTDFLMKKILK